jgi:acetyl esterase/lipase
MRLTRQYAAEWGIDPERIGAMGFSAGGHLAIRLAIEGDDGAVGATDPVERFLVVTLKGQKHFFSFAFKRSKI